MRSGGGVLQPALGPGHTAQCASAKAALVALQPVQAWSMCSLRSPPHPAHVQVLNGEVVACKQIDLEESEEMQEVGRPPPLLRAHCAAPAVAYVPATACSCCSGSPLLPPLHHPVHLPWLLVVCCMQVSSTSLPPMMQAFVTEATRLHSLRHPNVIGEPLVLACWPCIVPGWAVGAHVRC